MRLFGLAQNLQVPSHAPNGRHPSQAGFMPESARRPSAPKAVELANFAHTR